MEKIGVSKITLKKQTRANVLRTIKSIGPISRVDISARLGLTRAAITIITDELITQGIISEVGPDSSEAAKKTQGRRKILLDINSNFKFAYGVYADGGHISLGLSTLNGNSLDKVNFDLDPKLKLDGFCEIIENTFESLLTNNYLDRKKIVGVGIGIDPVLCKRFNLFYKDGEPDLHSLANALYQRLDMPVCCDMASSTLALGNIYFPEKRGDVVVSDAVFLQYGGGFGMVEFSDKAPVSYETRNWSYIENYIVCFNGRELNGFPRGSLKAELSLDVIADKIREKCRPITEEQIKMILEGYNSENVTAAVEVKNECLRMFGSFLYNIFQTCRAQKIILHKFSFCDNDFVYLIKFLEKEYPQSEIASVICRSRIDDKYAFLGGCALAVREFFIECGGLDLRTKTK